jgi:antitoxin component YwqK of YwqJK toxin-antitoxin module
VTDSLSWNLNSFPNGKLEQEGKYNNSGKQQGIWKWYFLLLP